MREDPTTSIASASPASSKHLDQGHNAMSCSASSTNYVTQNQNDLWVLPDNSGHFFHFLVISNLCSVIIMHHHDII